MTRTRYAAALLSLVLAATAAAQDTKKAETRREVVVTGCVEKTWLKVAQTIPAVGSYSDKYRLRGSKDLIKTLSHDLHGHRVEVTGLLDDPAKVQGDGKSMPVGKKGRVYIGAKEPTPNPPVIDPALDVRSFRDLAPTCR
jgi:hypothetical protein